MLHVRGLTDSDAAAYGRLRVASINESAELGSPEVMRELAICVTIKTGLLDRYATEGRQVWGIFHDEFLVGVVAITERRSGDRRDTIHLWGLYVVPDYRGSSASRRLMEAAIDWGRQQPGIAEITLHVPPRNLSAQELFRRFGFGAVDEEELCASLACAMTLELGASAFDVGRRSAHPAALPRRPSPAFPAPSAESPSGTGT